MWLEQSEHEGSEVREVTAIILLELTKSDFWKSELWEIRNKANICWSVLFCFVV